MRTPPSNSSLVTILKALMPYSQENLMFSFSPNRFFNELERNSEHSKKALSESFRRAQNRGLIEKNGQQYSLTKQGTILASRFLPSRLTGARLMVIFDIPESKSRQRGQLRRLLKRLYFDQVQKSVWVTDYDHKVTLQNAVYELGLNSYVELYECAKISKYFSR